MNPVHGQATPRARDPQETSYVWAPAGHPSAAANTLFAVLGAVGILVASAFASAEDLPARIAVGLVALLAVVHPAWFACLLIVSLPLFGTGPGGPRLPFLDAALFSGLGAWSLSRAIRRTPLPSAGLVGPAAALFLALSLASLLPTRYHPPVGNLADLALVTRFLLLANEYVSAYPLTKALHLLSATGAFLLALCVFQGKAGAQRFARVSAVLILLTAGAGIAERLGWISLAAFRPISPLYAERMHSFFDHPSWMAELLLTALPWPVLLLRTERAGDRALGTTALFLGLVAILFTLQRAAWITAALAALALASFEVRRRPKMVAAAGLTVALLIGSVLAVSPPARTRAGLLLSDLSNRSNYWTPTMAMARERLILGQGLGTYSWLYPDYVVRDAPGYMSMHGSAHNTYLMILAERGSLGLAAYFLLLGAAAMAASRKPRVGFPFILVVSVIGLVQYVFYVRVVELYVWCGLGVLASVPAAAGAKRERHGALLLFAATVGVLAAMVRLAGPPFPPTPNDREFGMHYLEEGGGTAWRWCYDACGVELSGAGGILKFDLADVPLGFDLERPLTIDWRIDDTTVREPLVVNPDVTSFAFPLEPTENGENRRVVLRPRRAIRPFLHRPTQRDPRLLSMRVSGMQLAPIRGGEFFGFDRPESDGMTWFRSTLGREGIVTLGHGLGSVPLRLRTFAPNVASDPLEVRIGSAGIYVLLELPDHEWHEISVPRHPTEGKILRFEANRTWLPAETGNSDDPRELAFSVAQWWD
ncbi:MAG: O-antigen ligase family protein [Candidatus Binatia bacterium]|nr:O-antigen ligase family protein [Candidatus Binatia bacterium]